MTTKEIDPTTSSALQLYAAAYQYHYENDDIKEACRLYREIIRHFPDSNESAYAVVQLEKIGAQEAIKSMQGSSWQKTLPFAALLFSLFALFIAGTALLLVLDKNRNSLYQSEKPALYATHNSTTDQSIYGNPDTKQHSGYAFCSAMSSRTTTTGPCTGVMNSTGILQLYPSVHLINQTVERIPVKGM